MEHSYTVFLHSERKCIGNRAAFFLKKKKNPKDPVVPLSFSMLGEARFEMASALICEIKGV